jgi:hypothetical protein
MSNPPASIGHRSTLGALRVGLRIGRPVSRQPLRLKTVFVLFVAALSVFGWQAATTQTIQPDTTCCDHLFYRSMAFNEFVITRPDLDRPPPGNILWAISQTGWHDLRNGLRRQPPFAYRIVTPLVARGIFSLTGNISVSFYVLTLLSLVGAGFFLALSIYSLTESTAAALLGLLVFNLNPASTSVNLWDYMLTDPLAFLLVSISLFALIRRQRVLFFLACAVGVFNKESMVPMLLAYPLSEVLIEGRLRRDSVAVVGVVAAAWFAFRHLLPIPVNRYSFIAEFRGTAAQTKLVAIGLISTFGVLLVASWRILISRLGLSLLPFVLANVLAAWFVGNIDRAMGQAVPALLVSSLAIWPETQKNRQLILAPFVLYALEIGVNRYLGVPLHIVVPPLFAIAIVCEFLFIRGLLSPSKERVVEVVA